MPPVSLSIEISCNATHYLEDDLKKDYPSVQILKTFTIIEKGNKNSGKFE